MANTDATILGRIDITLQFLHQFGDEDAYVAVECKRVRAQDASLNASYVSQGVDRFVTGKYAAGHEWGFMLGYVLRLPVKDIVDYVDGRIRKAYGDQAALAEAEPHLNALVVLENQLIQAGHHPIRLKHLFVDMLGAASTT
jgi:hypothetical protein